MLQDWTMHNGEIVVIWGLSQPNWELKGEQRVCVCCVCARVHQEEWKFYNQDIDSTFYQEIKETSVSKLGDTISRPVKWNKNHGEPRLM